MTNEELLQITDDKLVEKFIGSWVIAMEDIGPVPPLEVRQRAKNAHAQFKAELLCRLGAAVSAPPQPRCKVCNGSDLIVTPFGDFLLNIFCNGCGHEMRYEHPCDLRTLVGAFFAAAPAQEPRQVRNLDEIDESHIAAQEQPVENSPQKHCLGYPDCDGMLPGEEHEKECPLVGTFGPPSPQKDKP